MNDRVKVELKDGQVADGLCRTAEKTIVLRRADIFRRSLRFVKDTILHEIAHALTPNDRGHGKEWRDVAFRIGVRDPGYGRYNLTAKVREPKPEPTNFAKKFAHAQAQAKRLRTRIKRLETAVKKWDRRVRLYESKLAAKLLPYRMEPREELERA